MRRLADLKAPTAWATRPESFSFSSLAVINECPRRWQLVRSTWGEQRGFPERPHPAALEGQIVHEAIEHLAKALGRRGSPAIGSLEFQEVLKQSDFFGLIEQQILARNIRLAGQPLAGPGPGLVASSQDLANRAIRLFRAQYRPAQKAEPSRRPVTGIPLGTSLRDQLAAAGQLNECRLQHPRLPFVGVIDQVTLTPSGVHLVDFKTGQSKSDHRIQLAWYAVLWWRCTGTAPNTLVVQYLDHTDELAVGPDDLIRAEVQLEAAIHAASQTLQSQPAEPRIGPGCRTCPVRARCDQGWLFELAARAGDREVVLLTKPSSNGFLGLNPAGREESVVYDAAIGLQLPDLLVGERIRLVNLLATPSSVEIRAWTEVYRV